MSATSSPPTTGTYYNLHLLRTYLRFNAFPHISAPISHDEQLFRLPLLAIKLSLLAKDFKFGYILPIMGYDHTLSLKGRPTSEWTSLLLKYAAAVLFRSNLQQFARSQNSNGGNSFFKNTFFCTSKMLKDLTTKEEETAAELRFFYQKSSCSFS